MKYITKRTLQMKLPLRNVALTATFVVLCHVLSLITHYALEAVIEIKISLEAPISSIFGVKVI
jgi:hypothetical protein